MIKTQGKEFIMSIQSRFADAVRRDGWWPLPLAALMFGTVGYMLMDEIGRQQSCAHAKAPFSAAEAEQALKPLFNKYNIKTERPYIAFTAPDGAVCGVSLKFDR